MSGSIISVDSVWKSYGSLPVLKGVSFSVEKGEVVSIVGPSGAGKSTMLQLIGTLDRLDEGEIIVDGHSIGSMNDKMVSSFRNKSIGFIFQFHHLLPEFTAIENVCLPALIKGVEKEVVQQKAFELLKRLGVEHRMEHKPGELSGGEQQRVAACRALINDPAVILADEPSGNLDSTSARALHELFFELREEFKQTFVIVTHNESLAKMTDKVLEMSDGKIL